MELTLRLCKNKLFLRNFVRASTRFYSDDPLEVIQADRNRKSELHQFVDSLRVFVKGGKGGDGLPAKGGIGGKGGDVVMCGTSSAQFNLKKVQKGNPSRRYVAKPGMKSKLFCIFGEPGGNLNVPVPLGVTVLSQEGHKLGEINEAGDKVVAAVGGEGGSPYNGYSGQLGQAHSVILDLKLIADVGFVGFPNAGKSTLLKAISRAKPRIASYPFTTVKPNIGIIEYPDDRRISLADLPGLIEGAHANIGMGHRFLKHVERTKVLLFVVDLHGFQLSPKYPRRTALETIVLLNKELELYQEDLTQKPAILALNKIDKPGSYTIVDQIRETLFDQKKYNEYLLTLDPELRPNHHVSFDEIVPISAAKDPQSVSFLRDIIRKNLDINDEVMRMEKSSDNYLQAA